MSELLRYKDHEFIDVERILELHHAKTFEADSEGNGPLELCYECVVPFPCATVRLIGESHTIIVEEPPPVLRVARTLTESKAKLQWMMENPMQWIRWGHRKYPVTAQMISGPSFLRVYRKDPETGMWGLWTCWLGEGFEQPIIQEKT